MSSIQNWLTKKSLAKRLFLGFVGAASVIWICLVAWGIYTINKGGIDEVATDLGEYARQVLAVVQQFSDEPVRLARAISAVEDIENDNDESIFNEKMRIQVWLQGKPLRQVEDLPSTFPDVAGFKILEHNHQRWWTSTVIDSELQAAVRVAGISGVSLALTYKQAFFLFMPLVISLPLLLLPAWLMTRSGLKPLGNVVEQINQRAISGELYPLPDTPYHDLEPVVSTTNRLMSRLNQQLTREHEFVANVAHELKTPMAIMQANVGILENRDKIDRHKAAFADLKAGIFRCNHLIQQLLRMARMEQDQVSNEQLREIDLAELLRERVVQVEPLARQRQIELILDAPASCLMRIDTEAIAAIIDNLLDNAIKYSPSGESVEIVLLQDGDRQQIKLIIEDCGPGIPLAERDEVFTRFKRLTPHNSETEGTGLGLAIVHQASERIGADIKLMSVNSKTGLRAELTFVPDKASDYA